MYLGTVTALWLWLAVAVKCDSVVTKRRYQCEGALQLIFQSSNSVQNISLLASSSLIMKATICGEKFSALKAV